MRAGVAGVSGTVHLGQEPNSDPSRGPLGAGYSRLAQGRTVSIEATESLGSNHHGRPASGE
eukprot:5898850-Alexandrium_andersonii.AAC.1